MGIRAVAYDQAGRIHIEEIDPHGDLPAGFARVKVTHTMISPGTETGTLVALRERPAPTPKRTVHGYTGSGICAEVADGVFPMMMDPEKFEEVQLPHLEAGFAKAGGGKSLKDFAVVPGVTVIVADDIERARMPVKAHLSLYIGGMGAKKRNFHQELMGRMGFAEEAQKIQDLFLDGKRAEAVAAVPTEFADEISLVGPVERIKDRLQAWHETPVTTLLVTNRDAKTLQTMAELVL